MKKIPNAVPSKNVEEFVTRENSETISDEISTLQDVIFFKNKADVKGLKVLRDEEGLFYIHGADSIEYGVITSDHLNDFIIPPINRRLEFVNLEKEEQQEQERAMLAGEPLNNFYATNAEHELPDPQEASHEDNSDLPSSTQRELQSPDNEQDESDQDEFEAQPITLNDDDPDSLTTDSPTSEKHFWVSSDTL